MIIFYFLFILVSCQLLQKRQQDATTQKGTEVYLYQGLNDIEQLAVEIQVLTEDENEEFLEPLSQLYLLKGMQSNRFEDFIQARAFAFSCLSQEKVFQVEFLDQPKVHPERIDIDALWSNPADCSQTNSSNILSIPAEPQLVACATWALMSWANLTQMYDMERISIDSDHMLYLALWLGEHRLCLNTPWIPFALSLSISQAREELVEQKKLNIWMDRFFKEAEKSSLLRIDAFLAKVEVSLERETSEEQRRKISQQLDSFLSDPISQNQKMKILELRKKLRP